MRLILFALGIFAVSAYPSAELKYVLTEERNEIISTDGLKEDLDDFEALIPKTEILNIITNYLANDEEVQNVMSYILSDDFKQLILDIEAIPEHKEFLKYLQENGLNIYFYVNELHQFLGLPEFAPKLRFTNTLDGVRGMLDEIEAVLPIDKFEELFYEKLETSPAFYNLIEHMRGDEFNDILKQLLANKKFQKLIQVAKDNGVDINWISEILKKIFGWDFP